MRARDMAEASKVNGPRRGEWLFDYEVSALTKGTTNKIAEHVKREEFWTAEREKAIAALKSAGFEVREYEVTGGKEVQVMVDPTLQNRLSQCSHKLREHQAKLKEYRQWLAILVTQRQTERVELHMDDALYFGIAKQEPVD